MARDRITRKRRKAMRARAASRTGQFTGYDAPFVITPEMQAAAAEAAARDAADLDGEWAALSEDEQSWFGASFGQLPECDELASGGSGDGEPDAAGCESGYLRSLVCGELDPAAWLAVASAVPGSLGRAAVPADASRSLPDPGDAVAQLQVIDRLAAWVASRRFAVVAAACPVPLDAAGALGYRRELPY